MAVFAGYFEILGSLLLFLFNRLANCSIAWENVPSPVSEDTVMVHKKFKMYPKQRLKTNQKKRSSVKLRRDENKMRLKTGRSR